MNDIVKNLSKQFLNLGLFSTAHALHYSKDGLEDGTSLYCAQVLIVSTSLSLYPRALLHQGARPRIPSPTRSWNGPKARPACLTPRALLLCPSHTPHSRARPRQPDSVRARFFARCRWCQCDLEKYIICGEHFRGGGRMNWAMRGVVIRTSGRGSRPAQMRLVSQDT